jgi:dTDP-4-dehydrorhamnose reductase
VLDKSKIKENYNLEIPHWRESLKKCIDQMK